MREGGDSERLTVVGHHRVTLVMLLRRSQMVLYALKLRGQRRQRGQRSHLHSRKRHFLLAGHRHFRFRLLARQYPPTLPLPRCLSATDARKRQTLLPVSRQFKFGERESAMLHTAPALSAGKRKIAFFNFNFYFCLFSWNKRQKKETGK